MEQQFQRFERRVEICDQSQMTVGHYIWYFLTDPFGPYTKHTKLSLAWKEFYLTMVSVQAIVFAVMTMPEGYGRCVESEDVLSLKPCVKLCVQVSTTLGQIDEWHSTFPFSLV